MQHNYPGFSRAAVTRSAFQGINSCQVPIYLTWVECSTMWINFLLKEITPWLGFEPTTLCFKVRRLIHWATTLQFWIVYIATWRGFRPSNVSEYFYDGYKTKIVSREFNRVSLDFVYTYPIYVPLQHYVFRQLKHILFPFPFCELSNSMEFIWNTSIFFTINWLFPQES